MVLAVDDNQYAIELAAIRQRLQILKDNLQRREQQRSGTKATRGITSAERPADRNVVSHEPAPAETEAGADALQKLVASCLLEADAIPVDSQGLHRKVWPLTMTGVKISGQRRTESLTAVTVPGAAVATSICSAISSGPWSGKRKQLGGGPAVLGSWQHPKPGAGRVRCQRQATPDGHGDQPCSTGQARLSSHHHISTVVCG